MIISASNFMSDSTVVQKSAQANTVEVNNTLAKQLTGVENTPVAPASTGSAFSAIARFTAKVADATGLSRLASGLVSVGNAAGRLLGLGREGSSVLSLVVTGIKIAQYGVQKLLYDVMSLMKDQAWPIIHAWLTKIIEDGGRMTNYDIFLTLITTIRDHVITAIRDNTETQGLFRGSKMA